MDCRTVLVVGNTWEPCIAVASRVLQGWRYSVCFAASGLALYERVAPIRPAFILMDSHLADISVFRAIDLLRVHNLNMPVVVLWEERAPRPVSSGVTFVAKSSFRSSNVALERKLQGLLG